MSEAPKRIWASRYNGQDWRFSDCAMTGCDEKQEYIRADLAKPSVKALVWHKSSMGVLWDGDYHTVPTHYTIRGLGDGEYKLIWNGGFSRHDTPDAAKVAAQSHFEARIRDALE